ncbi:uncharacterized protein LOC118203880 [Stegodyphus dumicola]|uniref:uncharacterized protein LOC118203880 n=1 Tax=Stegodyphus dumicola TaxID=202533 RepID=UPI0015B2C5A2|nr:uncharacterized protein LOC118203880 [Stegodyphus dumicola]
MTKIKIDAKLKALGKMSIALDALRSEYYIAVPEKDDTSELEEELLDLEARIDDLEVSFNQILIDNVANINKVDIAKSSCKIKLPEIPLPRFSGKYEEWSMFKMEFNNIVTSNTQLTDAQKLHYLHAALKGEAKLLQTQEDTFESLFTALENRFENKRILVNTDIKAILEFEKIIHESSKELRRLVDAMNKTITALNNLGFERSKFSDILITTVILDKIDKETRNSNYRYTLQMFLISIT